MEHSFIDKYSERDSFIHKLDPRTKIISFLGFIILIVLTPPEVFSIFARYVLLLIGLIILSNVPIIFVLKRTLLVIPFVLMVVIFIPFFKEGKTVFSLNLGLFTLSLTKEGILVCWNALIKAILSVMLLTILISTTKFTVLLKGLEKLKVPKVMIIMLSFMYRYLFLLIDEAERMERARAARWFGGHIMRQIKVLGNIIALLFIRSYERSERVYAAMLARGFDGNIRTISNPQLTLKDAGFLIVIIILLLIIWV